jgi:ribosomal protein S7
MKAGRKHVVEKITLRAFQTIKKKTQRKNLFLFSKLVIKYKPLLGFISKRFGKQFKKIPVPLYPRRQNIVALT